VKIYIAGKVSNNSHFGTHDWRDGFCAELAELSGLELESLDPLKIQTNKMKPEDIFAKDCYLISESDVVVVYLSDDISVGGSQEILIAKYFNKPVIGLAPLGGKFNGNSRKIGGQMVENWRDPFVFSTCDTVCNDIESVARVLKNLDSLEVKNLDMIKNERNRFSEEIP
jgi:hypothetical protein